MTDSPTFRPAGLTAMIAAAAALAFALPAHAAPAKVVAGTLTCHGKGSVGYIVGSKERLSCLYDPSGTGRRHRYTASITKYGLDIGAKGESTLVWTVLGSTTDLRATELEGSYGGLSADASIGIGGGANALVGGSSDSVVLQPVSVQGQTGVNLAVGVSELSLRRR
jgi:hypothetical protein